MTATLTVPGAFDAAADLIEKHGKAIGRFIDLSVPSCPVCALGALALACGLPEDAAAITDKLGAFSWGTPRVETFTEACDVLLLRLGYPGLEETSWLKAIEEIGAWSDQHTTEHVVTKLRACAAQLQEAAR